MTTVNPSLMLRFVVGFLACVGIVGVLSCKKGSSPPAPPAQTVSVITATAWDVPDEPEFIGQTDASSLVEVRSQVTGIIKERYYREGRDVKKGDRLYQIDPVPFQRDQSSILRYQTLLEVSRSVGLHRELPALFRDLAGKLPSVVPFDVILLSLHDSAKNVMVCIQ